MSSGSGRGPGLTADERERLEAIRSAERLSDLVRLTGAEDEHDAYFEAKHEWYDLRGRELVPGTGDGVPGARVVADGHEFHVHGITHADTREEGDFLREHVSRFIERGRRSTANRGSARCTSPSFPTSVRWTTTAGRWSGVRNSASGPTPPRRSSTGS